MARVARRTASIGHGCQHFLHHPSGHRERCLVPRAGLELTRTVFTERLGHDEGYGRACENGPITDSARVAMRSSSVKISGASLSSASTPRSDQICVHRSCPRCLRMTPLMSTQSCGLAANALCTMRSSAEHVRSVAPRTSSMFDHRSIAVASNGIAPSATSIPNPSGVRSRSTRLRRANSAAPAIRLSNSASSAAVYSASPPNPVRSVRSRSLVRRGVPHRKFATPPMKQNLQP